MSVKVVFGGIKIAHPKFHFEAKRFGVARTVVREAISLLRYDGIVDSRRGVGAFVTETSQRSAFRISPACFEKRKQIVQLLQLRTGVQAGASALAATARTPERSTSRTW